MPLDDQVDDHTGTECGAEPETYLWHTGHAKRPKYRLFTTDLDIAACQAALRQTPQSRPCESQTCNSVFQGQRDS